MSFVLVHLGIRPFLLFLRCCSSFSSWFGVGQIDLVLCSTADFHLDSNNSNTIQQSKLQPLGPRSQ